MLSECVHADGLLSHESDSEFHANRQTGTEKVNEPDSKSGTSKSHRLAEPAALPRFDVRRCTKKRARNAAD